VHCKLFGETLICIGVSSADYSTTKRCQLVAPIGHGPSAVGASAVGAGFGLQGQCFGAVAFKKLASVRA
jgi:hypothetical protein